MCHSARISVTGDVFSPLILTKHGFLFIIRKAALMVPIDCRSWIEVEMNINAVIAAIRIFSYSGLISILYLYIQVRMLVTIKLFSTCGGSD